MHRELSDRDQALLDGDDDPLGRFAMRVVVRAAEIAGARFNEEAREVARLYGEIGCRPVWTCAPYQIPGGPGFGDQIIGSESNAVA